MLVTNPRRQKLSIQVKDALGFADTTVGTGEVTFYLFIYLCYHLNIVYLYLLLA